MNITLVPWLPLVPQTLSLSRAGDTLILNGEAFDFSALHEGASLPAERISSPWFVGPVSRINGELHLTLRLPHGPNLTEEVAFPEPLHVTEDGPIQLPGTDTGAYVGDVSAGHIDWSGMITAEQKEQQARKVQIADIATRRWKAETAGITVNGTAIDTGRDSQALITGAAVSAMLDPAYSVRWKTPAGFIDLEGQQIIDMATAVRAHVQAAFDREAELLDALADGTFTEAMMEEGWPDGSVPAPAAG